jgi:hypothetical protein
MDWFKVDKEGLAKLLARRGGGSGITGIAWLLFELLQNAWDTDASEVKVKMTPIKGRPLVEIEVVDDDYDGFADLAHAFTLFAESAKKSDPEKRGRFNIGEKLVLALCEEAKIVSTKGSIIFDKDGRREGKEKTKIGSVFHGMVRMTRDDYDEVLRATKMLIAPHEKRTWVNGEELSEKPRISGFRVTLPTEKADDDGFLRRTRRETLVQLHKPAEGETPFLYEMGIPVVELTGGEPWHVNIHQKVPLNADRDNVTPAYLRELRTAMLNHMHKFLKGEDDATKAWVRDAASDPNATKEAVQHVKTERFGEKAVIQDPSDPEGTKKAMAEGYTVIPGGSLSKGEWDNIKRDGIVLPAGQVTPSHPEKSAATRVLSLDEETEGMRALKLLVADIGYALLGYKVYAAFIDSPGATVLATWGGGNINFNVPRLGKKFFETGCTEAQVDLIIHELAHSKESDHFSKNYNDACTSLGAKLAFFIAEHPTFFKDHAW